MINLLKEAIVNVYKWRTLLEGIERDIEAQCTKIVTDKYMGRKRTYKEHEYTVIGAHTRLSHFGYNLKISKIQISLDYVCTSKLSAEQMRSIEQYKERYAQTHQSEFSHRKVELWITMGCEAEIEKVLSGEIHII